MFYLKKSKVFFTSQASNRDFAHVAHSVVCTLNYSTVPVCGLGFCLNSQEKLPLWHNTSIRELVSHVCCGPLEDGNQGAEEVDRIN